MMIDWASYDPNGFYDEMMSGPRTPAGRGTRRRALPGLAQHGGAPTRRLPGLRPSRDRLRAHDGARGELLSGYIETVPPPGKERLADADASHAWFAVYDPDAGWLNFDPTNDQMVVERHITTAWGREYSDVTPMKGIAVVKR
jgi:transglutaminase-like putative cysteine protease